MSPAGSRCFYFNMLKAKIKRQKLFPVSWSQFKIRALPCAAGMCCAQQFCCSKEAPLNAPITISAGGSSWADHRTPFTISGCPAWPWTRHLL